VSGVEKEQKKKKLQNGVCRSNTSLKRQFHYAPVDEKKRKCHAKPTIKRRTLKKKALAQVGGGGVCNTATFVPLSLFANLEKEPSKRSEKSRQVMGLCKGGLEIRKRHFGFARKQSAGGKNQGFEEKEKLLKTSFGPRTKKIQGPEGGAAQERTEWANEGG